MDASMLTPTPTSTPQGTKGPFDLVALTASAGGFNALTQVLAGLPSSFPAIIVAVQHLAPQHKSLMAELLSRWLVLPVRWAKDDDDLQAGTIYLAPPDHHVLVNSNGTLTLDQSPRVNFVRPSADRLFASVATSYGNRAIAVVLTGTGKDGAAGCRMIKRHGGVVLAQDEATAEFFGMPGAVIETGTVDFILPLDAIAAKLIALVTPPHPALFNNADKIVS